MNEKIQSLKNKKPTYFLAGGILVFLILIILSGVSSVKAQTDPPPATPVVLDSISMSDQECMDCHQIPDMVLPLLGGEQLYLTIDQTEYQESVHGQAGYACVQCHTDITGFPHPAVEATNLRSFSIEMADTCQGCHTQAQEEYSSGLHNLGINSGTPESAICTDCHGAHNIQSFEEDHLLIAETCQNCHSQIYEVYKDSVHGSALLELDDPNVPTCVDCHNAHGNIGPDQDGFHLSSPQICAECHADEDLMEEYNINTDVFSSYVSDFHGTTVTIFERISPDQDTNKPVCIDCHGVHNILPPENTESFVYKQNLLNTCQRCHPEATVNFPDAWLSHYPPDQQHNTLVYLVELFYKFLIPATLGGMAFFVATDAWRRYQERHGEGKDDKSSREANGESES